MRIWKFYINIFGLRSPTKRSFYSLPKKQTHNSKAKKVWMLARPNLWLMSAGDLMGKRMKKKNSLFKCFFLATIKEKIYLECLTCSAKQRKITEPYPFCRQTPRDFIWKNFYYHCGLMFGLQMPTMYFWIFIYLIVD